MRKIIAAFIILSVVLCPVSNADSLWKKESASPYSPVKFFKVGDILTILISENSTSLNKAGTKTEVKDDLSLALTNTVARLTPLIGTNSQITGSGSNKYNGSGAVERSNNVNAKVSAVVTEVLDNGNLMIEGTHRVSVNEEVQEIQISGMVRSKDVSVSNTVFSYQVAEAEVVMKDTGVVREAETPGWFTRFMNWLF